MDTRLGSKINEGISAEIFEWGNDGRIIKLLNTEANQQAMVTEYQNSQFAWNNGLPVPQPFELVEVDGRLGIVFERIYGETLMERFINQASSHSNAKGNRKELNYEELARISARILRETHSKPNQNTTLQRNDIMYPENQANYPSAQRDAIIKSIHGAGYLTTSEKKLVLDVLNSIPIKQQLCHGDPNLNNILIRDRDNRALLIDWMYASIGNPEADLAEYILMIRYSILQRNIPSEFKCYIYSVGAKIIEVFLDEYTKLSDITYEDIDSWFIPMAARRLSAGIISRKEKKLLAWEIRERLKKYN